MRFGCFTTEVGRIGAMADMGFDYVELGFRALVPLEDEESFAATRERILAAPLRAEALSGFFPPFVGLQVVGPEVDRAKVRRYTETMLTRAAQVGGRVIGIGGGRARSIPEGYPINRAREQFRDFLGTVGDLAATRGLTIALEPLNREETNLINTIPEALDLLRELNRPSLRVMVDYYHLFSDGDLIDDLVQAQGMLAHAHTSDAGRRPPGTEGTDQLALLRVLRAIGYEERLTIESRYQDFDREAPVALEYLRNLWAQVTAD
jgi:sugar phosphate isomerase/epimerase